jgi:NDP-sugar pyrophosphorylase family protein/aminoglycoside/choline kinase family phosphotransferase
LPLYFLIYYYSNISKKIRSNTISCLLVSLSSILKLSIFILAAGFGERLRPITEHFPKPLLPILGKPILQSVLEKVSTLPAHKIGINLHHKKEIITNWLRQSAFNKKVEIFPEESVFGTGGALKNAEAFLNTGIFLVHNSDIVSDIDLEKLIEFHLSSDNLVTLAVHDYPEFNKLEIDGKGRLKGMGWETKESPPSPTNKYLAFTGIAVYSHDFLKFLPYGFSSISDAWLKAIRAGHKIGTFDVTGCYWTDIGTPASYARAVIDKLRKNGEMVYIHPSIEICRHIELDGYVVAEEGTSFDKGVSLRNCILLPGSKSKMKMKNDIGNLPTPPLVKGRFSIENYILGPGFKIDLSESEMLGLSAKPDALLIGTGGSDKKYYRVKRDDRSAVLMECASEDPDFQRHIEYTRFFLKHSIPVPELISIESDKMSALFEDLGDLSLYSWLKCPRQQKETEEIYRRVIDILILIHTVATKHLPECLLFQDRIFDYEHLRWETGYFIESFIESIRNVRVKNLSALNDEFHKLALKVDSFPKTVIHRDFQSQNIMITKGGTPRLVDYQGARVGPPAYDVVSLLWDPYYRLEDNLRAQLLDYYIRKMKNATNPPCPPLQKGGKRGFLARGRVGRFFIKGELARFSMNEFNETEFRETLLPCRLQRHMQALGAYGFLSSIKGKKYFLKYTPEGLRLLQEDAFLSKDEYPVLYDLMKKL